MAYLVEKAGGVSSDGRQSILDLVVTHTEQRTQVCVCVCERERERQRQRQREREHVERQAAVNSRIDCCLSRLFCHSR